MIGLFRRESTGSGSGSCIDTSSDPALANQLCLELQSTNSRPSNSRPDRRSASICVVPISEFNESENGATSMEQQMQQHHTGPFGVTAGQRRNNRRKSLLELNG